MSFADAFLAIADPNRRHLLEEFRKGPKTVGQLAAGLPVSRPAVSQHLRILLDARLVDVHARAQTRLRGFDGRLHEAQPLARPVLGSMNANRSCADDMVR